MINNILWEEVSPLKIANLPTRPTAPTAFGGRGFSASEMKAAFDRLPLFIIERFNILIDAIHAEDEDSILADIPTGIKEGHTLWDLVNDIATGAFSEYLTLTDGTLIEAIESIRASIRAIKRDMGENYKASEFVVLDCGGPADRMKGGLPDAE